MMTETARRKAQLIIAGLGGQGVLFAGEMLARAALQNYKHISYMPSYGTEKRGGHSECTVVLSDHEIASPVLDEAEAVLVLDGGQAKTYEDRVRPGGLLVVEKAGLSYEPKRADMRFLPVSGLELAVHIGGARVNNLILLGAYTELTHAVTADVILDEIKRRAADREDLLKVNTEAFVRGCELGATLSR